MSTITIELPDSLLKRLRRESLSAEEIVIEALEEWLEKRREARQLEEIKASEPEHEQVMEAIESTGLLEPMGDEWKTLIAQAPRLSHAELQKMMAGKPPLSEIIIAERDEGR
ncbi:MAG TPA: hypothetical protein EYP19_16495 [Desulfobacterales bacterium]|nr:hypothetical protein [Desulfobacterales bacterium]